MIASKPILTENIQRVLANSYERLTEKVEAAIATSKVSLFGENTENVSVLGTFSQHALVLVDNRDVFRLRFESSADGGVKVVDTEVLEDALLTGPSLEEHLLSTARDIVENFIQNNTQVAIDKVEGLLEMVGTSSPELDKRISSQLVEWVGGTRPWKRMLGGSSEVLGELLGEDSSSIPSPKFLELGAGTLSEDKVEGYRSLVESDLDYAISRAREIVADVTKALENASVIRDKLSESKEAEIFTAFDAFVQDLSEDVGEVVKRVGEARSTVKDVAQLGAIYDAVAGQLPRYERARQFILKAAEELGSTENA